MKVRLLALTFGFLLASGAAWAGPTPGGADTDGDGVENAFDNCTAVSNTNQSDTDHNGCGDVCQGCFLGCDFSKSPAVNVFNPDGIVGAPDAAFVRSHFGNTGAPGIPGDCAGPPGVTGPPDGVVGAQDAARLRQTFGNTTACTGPSGITTAQCNPLRCQCTPAP